MAIIFKNNHIDNSTPDYQYVTIGDDTIRLDHILEITKVESSSHNPLYKNKYKLTYNIPYVNTEYNRYHSKFEYNFSLCEIYIFDREYNKLMDAIASKNLRIK